MLTALCRPRWRKLHVCVCTGEGGEGVNLLQVKTAGRLTRNKQGASAAANTDPPPPPSHSPPPQVCVPSALQAVVHPVALPAAVAVVMLVE